MFFIKCHDFFVQVEDIIQLVLFMLVTRPQVRRSVQKSVGRTRRTESVHIGSWVSGSTKIVNLRSYGWLAGTIQVYTDERGTVGTVSLLEQKCRQYCRICVNTVVRRMNFRVLDPEVYARVVQTKPCPWFGTYPRLRSVSGKHPWHCPSLRVLS